MYLVVIAWLYVVLMMSLVEALGSQGTVLGAVMTFLLYGLLPLSIVMYVLGTPARRRARQRQEAMADADAQTGPVPVVSPGVLADPDGRGHAAGDAVAAIRKEP